MSFLCGAAIAIWRDGRLSCRQRLPWFSDGAEGSSDSVKTFKTEYFSALRRQQQGCKDKLTALLPERVVLDE